MAAIASGDGRSRLGWTVGTLGAVGLRLPSPLRWRGDDASRSRAAIGEALCFLVRKLVAGRGTQVPDPEPDFRLLEPPRAHRPALRRICYRTAVPSDESHRRDSVPAPVTPPAFMRWNEIAGDLWCIPGSGAACACYWLPDRERYQLTHRPVENRLMKSDYAESFEPRTGRPDHVVSGIKSVR